MCFAAWAAAIATIIEIAGLALVIGVASPVLLELPVRWPELLPPADAGIWSGIMLGAFLAFYAFIGFEDMVNVAEEVQDPQRNLPRAILLALVLATALYLLVALVAVLSLGLGIAPKRDEGPISRPQCLNETKLVVQ